MANPSSASNGDWAVEEPGNNPLTASRLVAFFEAVWHHSPDNMFIIRLDPGDDFVTEAVNPTLADKFGLDCTAIAGTRVRDVVPEEYHENVLGRYRQCITNGKPITYEEIGHAGDADPSAWSTLLVPVFDEMGVARIYGISRDITPIWRAEQDLAKAKKELEIRVEERTQELRQLNETLHELATRDELTQCYNRRYFFELAEREFEKAQRHNRALSVFMLDADHFKAINDVYGHGVGDRVLRSVADCCQRNLRHIDVFGRYGGEEFAGVLPDSSLDSALVVARRIQSDVAQQTSSDIAGDVRCTVSIGVAGLESSEDTLERLLTRADQALLTAKRAGRNRVVIQRFR